MSKVWFEQIQMTLVGAIAFSALGILPSTSVSAQSIPPVKDVIGQNVTSVSQLSDVRPTDWAFTALQSLVERYGCIAGYPDRTFRGKQATSRYEFAAGLNACLDKINEIISAGLADKVSKEDLATLQKLQEEFAAELATLRGRVDVLDAKTAKLEAQQFSTTTKLGGQVIASVSASGSGSNNLLTANGALSGNSGKANTTVISRVRLELRTSFTGEDLLLTRLDSGNNGSNLLNSLDSGNPTNDILSGFTGFRNSSAPDYSNAATNFSLGILRYDFPIGKDIRAVVGPSISLNNHLDANSYANDESADFSGGLFINNPLTFPVNNGAGGVLSWNFNQSAFTIRAGYVAANASSPTTAASANGTINRGLFGDNYQGTAELEFAPKNTDGGKSFALRLQYTRAAVNNLDYSAGGVNLEWTFNNAIAIFGRYGFGNISNRGTAISTALPSYTTTVNTSLNPQTWSAGFAFPDLFKEGAMAAIAVGQPFVENQVGTATQTNVEIFYRFPISDNISITPDLQFIFNPNNNSGNSTITVGTLRTVFSF